MNQHIIYHFSPKSDKPEICNAKDKPCPYSKQVTIVDENNDPHIIQTHGTHTEVKNTIEYFHKIKNQVFDRKNKNTFINTHHYLQNLSDKDGVTLIENIQKISTRDLNTKYAQKFSDFSQYFKAKPNSPEYNYYNNIFQKISMNNTSINLRMYVETLKNSIPKEKYNQWSGYTPLRKSKTLPY